MRYRKNVYLNTSLLNFIVLKIVYSAHKHVNSVMLRDRGYLFVTKNNIKLAYDQEL